MHLRETYELSRGMRQGSIKGRPSAGWGVLRDTPGPGRRRPRLQRDMSTGALPGSKKNEFILYRERWLMLAIVSALALLAPELGAAAASGAPPPPPEQVRRRRQTRLWSGLHIQGPVAS